MTIDRASQILVMDDSGAVRSIVRKLLTQLDYIEVDEASDGAAALEKMTEKLYGLVISDWNMEPVNGKALLEKVRSKKQFETLPFILMTTASEQYTILKARYVAVSLISKPFTAEDLKSKISEVSPK